jgi:ACS family pantothenate transporter-like MFS transporter
MYLIEIPALLIYTYISDRTGNRFLVCLFPLIWGIFPTGVLAFWPSSNALKVFAFMVNGTIYITPVFYAWVSEICHGSPEERGFIVGATSCLFYW